MPDDDLQILSCEWETHQDQLASIRFKVFVEEQRVPKEMEIDEDDPHALHFLILDISNNLPIATGRLLDNGHIGRMAVIKGYRHRKVGSKLLSAIMNEARKRNMSKVFLNAQTSAVGFYEKNGFTAYGKEFMDAGIPHIKMTLTL